MSDFIIEDFYDEMSKVNLNAFGILDSNAHIHTLGTDSKIIGRIFEMFTQPVLEHIAQKHNLLLKTPEKQTVYPDFILMRDESSTEKIAIDVKTTYIENGKTAISFSLGSFASYMRNNTKNIAYQYTDYARHMSLVSYTKGMDKHRKARYMISVNAMKSFSHTAMSSFSSRKNIKSPATSLVQETQKI